MIVKVMSVYDVKAQSYKAPFFAIALGLGSRMFADACVDNEIGFKRHPEDYILYHIGEFDDNQGTFQNIVPPVLVARATDFVVKQPIVFEEKTSEEK